MSNPASAPRGVAADGRAPVPGRAVVIGAGPAGLLAAAALQAYADVTVVERDVLPAGPGPRKGIPQARHAHPLWSGGARAMEELVPGVTAAWLAAGARRIALPTGLVTLSSRGWLRRWPETEFMISCSRDLLDAVLREQVARSGRVTVLESTELLGLEGDASRVKGVRVRTSDGAERVLDADLVVDAAGRGSRSSAWLDVLGVPPAPMDEIDSGLAFASRVFRAPAGAGDFPVVMVRPDPAQPVPGRSATVVPLEGERWLVTLSGTRGGQPTAAAEEFELFARSLRHPLVGELVAHTEPLTDVVLTRSTINRRRLFEKVRDWPEGFVALGDSVATFNPVHGHGMSVAAQGALALRGQVAEYGVTAPGLARRAQRAVALPVAAAWELARATDLRHPEAIGEQAGVARTLFGRYVERVTRTAAGHPLAAKALLSVTTLSAPATALVRPEVLLAVLRGPRHPALTEPPLTPDERSAVFDAPEPSVTPATG
ncbi:NAD(P)/FAD-dependent oxidoreductase [Streptomyces sp. NPDC001089]